MKFVDGCFEGFCLNANRNVPSREQVQHLLATVTEVCVLLRQFLAGLTSARLNWTIFSLPSSIHVGRTIWAARAKIHLSEISLTLSQWTRNSVCSTNFVSISYTKIW